MVLLLELCVVYLLIPTSNHNQHFGKDYGLRVVYLLIPTSNHNQKSQENVNKSVVYLLIPTSNHNHNWIILVLELLYIF